MKKGQVNLFIVISIIIIAIIGGVVFLRDREKGTDISKEFFSSLETQSEFTSLSSSVINCMEEITKESLFKIGLQGGYYEKPERFYDLDFVFIPYYYYEGKVNMPSKEIIQKEIGKYVNDNLKVCFDKELEISKIRTKVKINPNKVSFVINSGLTFEKDGSIFLVELREHPINYVSSLSDIIDVANYFVEERNKEMMCVTCLEDLLIEKDVFLNSIDLKGQDELIIISENRTTEEVYAFEFMMKEEFKETNTSNTDLNALFGE